MTAKYLPTALLVAALGLGSAALAAPYSASGTIKAIDAKAMTVTLEDGTVYKLPAGFDLAGFKVGEKVALTWEMKGSDKDIDTMVAG